MAMSNTTLQDIQAQLPNPFTPLAFLPPDLAFQVNVSHYTAVGSLAVMIWDIVINLGADWKLVTKYRIGLPTIFYFMSRWGCLAYLLGITIIQTAPVENCDLVRWIQLLYPFGLPFSSLLFFLRVQAIYEHNKYIVGFFFISWLGVLGGCITPIFGLSGSNIGITPYCLNTRLESYVSAAGLGPLINDTLVFIATTWRLVQNAYAEEGLKGNLKTAFLGYRLPMLSKALLQDGQVYYLTTISLNLVTDVLFFTKTGVPIVYRSFIGVPNIVLMNSMACYVFRNVKFGVFNQALSRVSVSNHRTTIHGHENGRNGMSALVFHHTMQTAEPTRTVLDNTNELSTRKVTYGEKDAGMSNVDSSQSTIDARIV
ncbi:hypothetical protein CVT24_010251 [Panaeolus cyanescens]|uniref:DUF6533 domain-containing protein n=1 Tax=Panaeolus cyanescens TaxID=181874 RepID=A0A409YPA5_9AGAR|nr:hypothetical protein CVT24_010251 [Panaeolus cyanescens]